jgi:ubiquinone/menaquinone biosynthesis C-methylase UbiE
MVARADASADSQALLADLLRCPACGAGIAIQDTRAICRAGEHRYPLVGGVVMMLDEETLASDPQYDQQRTYFDAEFESYDRYSLENWRISYLDRLSARELLGGPDLPMVDVGVGGSGYTVIEAARKGYLAVGCDLSLEGLVKARAFAVAEGVVDRTLWVCCSAERLPLVSGAFVSALAIAVIEHVPDDDAALREIARVLRPGGRAWITVPHALQHISPIFRGLNSRHDRKLGHLRRFDANTLRERSRNVGLEEEEILFTGHPVKVLQLLGAKFLRGRLGERFWWWCEARDLERAREQRRSMQLSAVFRRSV